MAHREAGQSWARRDLLGVQVGDNRDVESAADRRRGWAGDDVHREHDVGPEPAGLDDRRRVEARDREAVGAPGRDAADVQALPGVPPPGA